MRLSVNGEARELPPGGTIADLVAVLVPGPVPAGPRSEATREVGGTGRGIAVAVNGAVVPRGEWSATALRPGDAVEVLTAVQGG
jgi:sulfur carrier protein